MNASLYQPEGNDVSDLLNSFIRWISCAVIEEFGKGEKRLIHILYNVYNLYYFVSYHNTIIQLIIFCIK